MKKSLLSRFSLFCVFVCITSLFFAQDFTWKKGSNLANQDGTYGTAGVSAPANTPGGRSGAAFWKDQNGNYWLFGGEGYDDIGNNGYLSDLWKYDPTSNEWTFIKGNTIIAQISSYGTLGVPSASNFPGGRIGAAHWADASGNLWMFGGFGYDSSPNLGYLNDLWKYNISTNEWTWVAGSNLWWPVGNYGTQGVPSATTTPGGRAMSSTWADALGNLWLFGGNGVATTSVVGGALNDLWKYNISSGQWTWMKGSNSLDQNGVYGNLGSSSPANTPGGRAASAVWIDNVGNFWMFGGSGFDAASTASGYLNDLWKYDVPQNAWIWVKGSNVINQIGAYGLQGVANFTNVPGARDGAIGWRDALNNLWLFGGHGYPGSASAAGGLNDLWKYDFTHDEWMWVKGSAVTSQNGTYGTQGAPAFGNRPGARELSANWIDGSDNLWLFGGYGYPATGSDGDLNCLWKYTNCFVNAITLNIISGDSSMCVGLTTSLTASGSNNYLWAISFSTTPYVVISPSVTTTYTVYSSNSNNCIYQATFTQTVDACVGTGELKIQDSRFKVYPNPNNGEFFVELGQTDEADLIIINTIGQKVFEQKVKSGNNLVRHQLPAGVYYFELKQSNQGTSSGKILVE